MSKLKSELKKLEETLSLVIKDKIVENVINNCDYKDNYDSIKKTEQEIWEINNMIQKNIFPKKNKNEKEKLIYKNEIKKLKNINEEKKLIEKKQNKVFLEKKRKKLKKNFDKKKEEILFKKKYFEYKKNKREKKINVKKEFLYLTNINHKKKKIQLERFLSGNLKEENKFNIENFFSFSVFEIFEKIRIHNLKNTDSLKKSMIIKYFLINNNLFKIYDISPQKMIEEIINFESNEINFLNENELIKILSLPRESISVSKINYFKQNNPVRKIHNFFEYYYFLENQDLKYLENKFNQYSEKKFKNKSQILNFIEKIHKNWENLKILNILTYYITPINRIITLSQILLELRGEIINNNAQINLNKKKEDCWPIIQNYIKKFTLTEKKNFEGLRSFAVLSLYEEENFIDFEYLDYVHKLFMNLENISGFVNKDNLLISIRNDEFFDDKWGTIVRKNRFQRRGEILEDFLERVEQETDDYIDWNEFSQFFTRRGFPILVLKYNEEDYGVDEKKEEKNDKKVYLWSLPNYRDRKNYLKSIWSQKHFEKIFGKDLTYYKNKDPNVTVPKNFIFKHCNKKKFYEIFWEELEKKKEEDIQEVLNYKIPFTQIPDSTYYNIYQQMVEQENLKKEFWKEKREKRIKEKNYEKEKINIKKKPKIKNFKARDMPEYCKPGLYKKLVEDKIKKRKEQKEMNKELIEKRKQKIPYYSHMPLRFQNYAKKKLMKEKYFRNRSLEEENPNFTFKPSITKKEVSNYEEYFKDLYDNFKKDLSKQKSVIYKDLQNKDKSRSLKPFNFLLRNDERKKHNCFRKVKFQKPKILNYKKILNSISMPHTNKKFEGMKSYNLNRKHILQKQKKNHLSNINIKNKNDYKQKFKAKILPKTKSGIDKQNIIRNVLIDKEDFDNCCYNE